MENAAKNIIEMRNVTKLYKNGRGIKNVSLTAERGDIIGLLGSNGSGKTTLMKVLLGLLRPQSGKIRIFGLNPDRHFEKIMLKTGALIEAPAIYKHLTAHRNLKLRADMYGISGDRLDEMLERVRLLEYKNEKAGRFSLGMKQRLGLAMAFVSEPELVILDEPVNGLDIEGVVEIRELIQKMNRENGATFIISSHIASEIEKLCAKVAVINDGEITDFSTMDDVLRRYPSAEEYFLDAVRAERRAMRI